MELENMIAPYVESLINQSLQEIEYVLRSEDLSNKENITSLLEGVLILKEELNDLGGMLSPHITDKINEITDEIHSINTLGDDE